MAIDLFFRSSISEDKSLGNLCQETLDTFKQCLECDLQTFREEAEDRVACILSGKECSAASERTLLPPDVVLKLTALAISPSHSLRQLGQHVDCSELPELKLVA